MESKRKYVSKRKVDKKQDKRIAKLEKAFKAETQYLGVVATGVTLNTWSTGGGILNCTPITQGAGNGQRIGDKINVRRVNIVAQITGNAVSLAGDGFMRYRAMLIWTKANQQALPVAAELFADATSDTTIFFSPLNKQYKWKYKVLYDKFVTLNMQAWNSTAGTLMRVSKTLKISKKINKVTQFATATSAAFTDIEDGLLIFAVFSPDNTATGGMNFGLQTEYTP